MSVTEPTQTRREAMQRIAMAGGTLTLPGYVNVVRGATDSGNAELTVDATIPDSTSATITVYEIDNNGDESNNEIEVSDGETTYFLPSLTGDDSVDYEYYLYIHLQTDDDTTTPQINQAELTLPGPNQEPEYNLENIYGYPGSGPNSGSRFEALIGNDIIGLLILLTLGAAAVGKRINAYAALASAQVGMIILFFGGFVPLGLTLLSVPLVGMLALNIERNVGGAFNDRVR